MEEILLKLLDKYLLKPIGVIVLLMIFAVEIINSLPSTIDTTSDFEITIYFKTKIVLYIIILLIYSIVVYYNNQLPKVKKNTLGILLIVNTETTSQFLDIKCKLIDKFDEILKLNTGYNFDSVYKKEDEISNFDFNSRKFMLKLLKKTNCIYAIRIKILSDDIENATKYELSINNGVLHPQFNNNVHELFKSELNSITSYIQKTRFVKSDKIEQLEVTATQLVFACKYIIGITHFLGGKLDYSEQILVNLYNEINGTKRNINIVNHLKSILPNRCYDIYMYKSLISYQKYKEDKDKLYLEEFGDYLDNANKYIPNTYDYFLNISIYYICSKNDLRKAKESIKECSKLNTNNLWRYSDAFLYSFEKNGFLTIYKKYKLAFRTNYNLNEIASFIEDMLDEHPDSNGLNFALGMVYSEIGDDILSKEYFSRFQNFHGLTEETRDKFNIIVKERIELKLIKTNGTTGASELPVPVKAAM